MTTNDENEVFLGGRHGWVTQDEANAIKAEESSDIYSYGDNEEKDAAKLEELLKTLDDDSEIDGAGLEESWKINAPPPT